MPLLRSAELLSPDPGGDLEGDLEVSRIRRIVGAAGHRVQLTTSANGASRRLDGWSDGHDLVVRAAGDGQTPREAVVVPLGQLAPWLAAVVDLGPRAAVPVGATDQVDFADLTAVRLGGRPVLRLWSLRLADGYGVAGAGRHDVSVIDTGPDGSLWRVVERAPTGLTVAPVSPVEVWLRVAGFAADLRAAALSAAPSGGAGRR